MSDREPGGEGGFDRDKDRDQEIDKDSEGPSGSAGGAGQQGWPGEAPGFDPANLSSMLEQVLGQAAENPELAAAMRSMGVDPADPATKAAMRAQLGSFTAAQQSPTGARDLATDVARKHVLATQGNDVHDATASRAVEDAVAVAVLWLDEVTTLGAPSWRATGFSRAEWVEATMPRWFDLVEPVSDGVTSATSAAIRKQLGELGPEAFGDALPPELQGMMGAGFDPAAMLEQWAPMLSNLSRQMFAAQLGQAVGTLATEVVGATEVGLPLTEPGLVALLPGNVDELATSLEIDLPQVRLYLAVREAARVRLFAQVPWLGPQLMSAVADYANNITIDTDAIESALSTIDATDPEALRSALQGNLFRPQPTPVQRRALDRLETLLALAEGWVDHVTERATAAHLPQSPALAETIRRRRVGGAAQKTFAGLVGLELRPRRMRDAANLWAALENAGGQTLRDGRWSHPDLAPNSDDLDDIIGFVERATGPAGADQPMVGLPESTLGDEDLGTDLDSVLRGILDEAAAGESGGTDGNEDDDEGDGRT
jgi:putative hydrolase